MWIDLQTGLVAQTFSDVRLRRPNWSGPANMTEADVLALGFAAVTLVTPIYDPLSQAATEQPPKLINGVWTQQWTVTALDAATTAAKLAAAKTAKNDAINAARLGANYTTFTYAGKQIACDTLSRSDIDGANGYVALFGVLPPNWVGGWKTVDNSYVPIATVDEWKAFYKAMYDQGSTNFAKAQGLKTKLANAATQADLDALTWSAQA